MKKLSVFSILILVLANTPARAAECLQSQTATELLRCSLRAGPAAQVQQLELDSQKSLLAKERQFRNPEADFESVSDGNGGQNTEASLLFDFEIFGQRSSRVQRAKSAFNIAEKQYLISKSEMGIEIVKSLYRLRQLETEAQITEETAATFSNVTKPYRGRLRLSPEQEVSLSVFEIAAEETRLQLMTIQQEKERVAAFLRSALQSSGEIDRKFLPPLKTAWPQIEVSKSETVVDGLLTANERKAEAELAMEKSQSWPEFKLGPKYEKSGSEDAQVGVALSMTLPIFSVNSAGRAAAASQLNKVKIENRLNREKAGAERANLLKVYRDSAEALERSTKSVQVSKRHDSLHRLLRQGLVNASLVIELHRQLYNYQVALHDHELKGVESYWKLLALEGRIQEGEIK